MSDKFGGNHNVPHLSPRLLGKQRRPSDEAKTDDSSSYSLVSGFLSRVTETITGICSTSWGPQKRHHFQSGEYVYVESCQKYGTVLVKFPDDLYQVRLENGLVSNFKPALLKQADHEFRHLGFPGDQNEAAADGVTAVARFAGALPSSPHYAPLRGRSNSIESINLLQPAEPTSPRSTTSDPDYTPPVPTYAPPTPVSPRTPGRTPRTPKDAIDSLAAPTETAFDWGGVGDAIRTFWSRVTSFTDTEYTSGEEAPARPRKARILVLGASPLQLHDHGGLSPLVGSPRTPEIQKLNLQAERRMIQAVSEEAGSPCDIEFSYLNAVKLKASMVEPPDILQLTGHGVSNGAFQYLALEKQDGSTHLLTPEQLRPLVEDREELPTVVVLGACYSERFGKIFSDAGVPHVICCKDNILDSTLLNFERGFYSLLFQGYSVRAAVAEGVRCVKSNCDCECKISSPIGAGCQHRHCSPLHCVEASKLLLLPTSEPHEDIIVDTEDEERELPGLITSHSGEHCSLPAAIQPFVGRADEMQRLISKLVAPDTRCINLTGEPLIGKSAVAIQACHYLRRRNRFSKIHYVNLVEDSTLSKAIGLGGRGCPGEEPTQVQVAQRLQNEDCLVLVDNCTEQTPCEVLKELVYLVKNTYRAKFLVTSRELLDFESTDGMDITHLPAVGPLEVKDGMDLVRRLFPELLEDLNNVMTILNISKLHPEMLRRIVVRYRRKAQETYRQRIRTSRNNISTSSLGRKRRSQRKRRRSMTRVITGTQLHRAVAIRKRSLSID